MRSSDKQKVRQISESIIIGSEELGGPSSRSRRRHAAGAPAATRLESGATLQAPHASLMAPAGPNHESVGHRMCRPRRAVGRRRPRRALAAKVHLVRLLFALLVPPGADAFCPLKCLCNDETLSANCTQVPLISMVPMTFNPSLKRLALNHLPLTELSNSLSVYPNLEYLSLNWNQLRQIKYHNFNFSPAPHSLQLSGGSGSGGGGGANSATQLKSRDFERDLVSSSNSLAHLRELSLADNRIEQLGEESRPINEQDQAEAGTRLRSAELERRSPFLGLTRLLVLELAGNRLSRLGRHAFLGLMRLRRLDLSRNSLEFIDRHSFVGLIELESLKLSQNRLGQQLAHLGQTLCRAPVGELRELDLSDNRQAGQDTEQGQADILLPHQMFVCADKLTSLDLSGLQLRHIQVSAFDNLRHLEWLSLARNQLSQVPSEALAYSKANLSMSLRHLNLNDNLIEFVNAGSLSSLRSLEVLSMQFMPRLVSFDLAALSFRYSLVGDGLDQMARLATQDGTFNEALKGLLPEHLYARLGRPQAERFQPEVQLINDQLIELRLAGNRRLVSLRSSLATRDEQPRGRIKFNKLRLLDLSEALELRELPLEQIMDIQEATELADAPGLLVDLSSGGGQLNCTGCQTSWLIEAGRRQFSQQLGAGTNSNKLVSLADWRQVGCSWPAAGGQTAVSLGQLIELEAASASNLLGHCMLDPLTTVNLALPPSPPPSILRDADTGPALLAWLGALLLLAFGLWLLAKALSSRQAWAPSSALNWLPGSPPSSLAALSSPSSSASSSSASSKPRPAYNQSHVQVGGYHAAFSATAATIDDNKHQSAKSRGSIVVGQIERTLDGQRKGNLFSRIADLWRGHSAEMGSGRPLASLLRADASAESHRHAEMFCHNRTGTQQHLYRGQHDQLIMAAVAGATCSAEAGREQLMRLQARYSQAAHLAPLLGDSGDQTSEPILEQSGRLLDGAHIYVTLDGPIRERREPADEYCALQQEAGAYSGDGGRNNHKSLEWVRLSEGDSPVLMVQPESLSQFKSACKWPANQLAPSSLAAASGARNLPRTSTVGTGAADSPLAQPTGNVTERPDCAHDRSVKADRNWPIRLERAGVTLAAPSPPPPPPSCKYDDANHEDPRRVAGDKDKDYAINGSLVRPQKRRLSHQAPTGVAVRRSPSLIGQQSALFVAAKTAGSGSGPCAAECCDQPSSKLTYKLCDDSTKTLNPKLILKATTTTASMDNNSAGQLMIAGRNKPSPLQTSARRSRALDSALAGQNQQEIYSNQYYYCKPSSSSIAGQPDQLD